MWLFKAIYPILFVKMPKCMQAVFRGPFRKMNTSESSMHKVFRGVTIHKEKEIVLPDEMMLKYLSAEELKVFRDSGTGIFSITISGSK
jgi:hypothetical protein